MGLDISAYAQAEFLYSQQPQTENEWDRFWETGNLVSVKNWGGWEQFEGLQEGVYRVSSSMGFRAGSYSGYNAFRADLCRFALKVDPDEVWNNLGKYKGAPFVELINFSDCEGFIGPVASEKLYSDFQQHWTDYSLNADEYSASKYNDWLSAFDLAREDGFVEFH